MQTARRTARQPELEEELQELGFVRPSGAGQMLKGWVHPELKLGFEVVAEVPWTATLMPCTCGWSSRSAKRRCSG